MISVSSTTTRSIKNESTTAQKLILNYLEDDDEFKKRDICSYHPDDWKIMQDIDLSGPTPQQVDFLDNVFTYAYLQP